MSPVAGSSSISSFGLPGQAPGEFDPLQRAVRQAGALTERDVGEAEIGEDRVRLLLQRAFLLASAEVEHRREERLLGTGVDPDHDVLDHASSAATGPGSGTCGTRRPGEISWACIDSRSSPSNSDGSRWSGRRSADDVEQRGLAGTVRADQPADLSLFDPEGEIAQRHDAAEAHRDVTDVEHRHRFPPN